MYGEIGEPNIFSQKDNMLNYIQDNPYILNINYKREQDWKNNQGKGNE